MFVTDDMRELLMFFADYRIGLTAGDLLALARKAHEKALVGESFTIYFEV